MRSVISVEEAVSLLGDGETVLIGGSVAGHALPQAFIDQLAGADLPVAAVLILYQEPAVEGFPSFVERVHAVADAGAFSIVIEKVIEPLAREITTRVPAPTIGIGASPGCDGQILVIDDLIGLFTAFRPKFVKRYAELGNEVEGAAARYAADVRARRFPGPDNIFGAVKRHA